MIAVGRSGVHGEVRLADGERRAFQDRVLSWFQEHGRDLPWRRTVDPYAILVSEVMLQQTQVPRVVPRYQAFLERFPAARAVAAAPVADVLALWSGLGYNNRAVRLREACGLMVERHGGSLPVDEPDLLALPGVGRYTARAVQAFAWNRDVAAVDTNVRRVLVHELGLDPALPQTDLEEVALAALPRGRSREWHHALMDYGSAVVTSRGSGIGPRHRQSPFAGSRRQVRGAVLRALLAEPQGVTSTALAGALQVDASLLEEALEGLERDGLVLRGPGGEVRLEDRP